MKKLTQILTTPLVIMTLTGCFDKSIEEIENCEHVYTSERMDIEMNYVEYTTKELKLLEVGANRIESDINDGSFNVNWKRVDDGDEFNESQVIELFDKVQTNTETLLSVLDSNINSVSVCFKDASSNQIAYATKEGMGFREIWIRNESDDNLIPKQARLVNLLGAAYLSQKVGFKMDDNEKKGINDNFIGLLNNVSNKVYKNSFFSNNDKKNLREQLEFLTRGNKFL